MPAKSNPQGLPPHPEGGFLFLDLSTVTGWAYGLPGGPRPVCGAFVYPAFSGDGATFGAHYEALADVLEHYSPKRVMMEAPLPPNAVTSNIDTWKCQIGLMGVTQLAAKHYGLTVRDESVRTIRSKVLVGYRWHGKQLVKGEKPVIMQWAHDHGFDPPDHNACDALVGLEYQMRLYAGRGFIQDLAS
jgi:hypothetical protein